MAVNDDVYRFSGLFPFDSPDAYPGYVARYEGTNTITKRGKLMAEFLAMNGHGVFIWPCYGLTFALVIGIYMHSLRRLKQHKSD